jgi:hypothetical protein
MFRWLMTISFAAWLLTLTGAKTLNAGIITDFSQITGASFYDAPANNVLASPTIGSVTVTPHSTAGFISQAWPAFGAVAGVVATQYGSAVPGTGGGFTENVTAAGGGPYTSLTLDFSNPVAAFGATFMHFQNVANDPSWTLPVTIQVFSGLDGTGSLIGTVTDPGGGSFQGPAFVDFRGVWSNSVNISSAIISASSPPSGGYAVDGYAISLTPQSTPEPMTMLLTTVGLVGLGIVRRYKKYRK